MWKHGRIGDSFLKEECGPGHESAGEVVEVGKGAEGQWKIGQSDPE